MDDLNMFTIIAVADALISAGISDPYEIYQYISTTEVGNVIGIGNKNNFEIGRAHV